MCPRSEGYTVFEAMRKSTRCRNEEKNSEKNIGNAKPTHTTATTIANTQCVRKAWNTSVRQEYGRPRIELGVVCTAALVRCSLSIADSRSLDALFDTLYPVKNIYIVCIYKKNPGTHEIRTQVLNLHTNLRPGDFPVQPPPGDPRSWTSAPPRARHQQRFRPATTIQTQLLGFQN